MHRRARCLGVDLVGTVDSVVIVGFALLGAVLAPVFPALVTLTPVRIGPCEGAARDRLADRRRQRGAAGISALTGIILQHEGLRTLGPSLVVIAVALIGCNAALELFSRR